MERDATILYLKNVLDLETAKNKIARMYRRDERDYQKKTREIEAERKKIPRKLNEAYVPRSPYRESWVPWVLLSTAFFVMGVFIIKKYQTYFISFFSIWWGIFFLGRALGKISYNVGEKRAYKIRCRPENVQKVRQENQAHNQMVDDMITANQEKQMAVQNQWMDTKEQYLEGHQRVQELLSDFYGMNLIPNRYRSNLAAIYYIYDWMSSTQDTLSDVLARTQFEEGIQRVEAKMDQVIGNLEDVLYETRCVGANLQTVISKNTKMLQYLQAAEQNTAAGAEYARLAANYSRANAFFAAANYLK